ncbi:MAG: DUF2520 domain-containing protein [Sphingobacteriales bacterium]|nr:DUF2520 domain-containing protein [Sphingobacteriales bacterium]
MKIAILGSGNVATHLGKALIKAGHPVMQVWSRNHNHAIDLALEIGANSIPEIKNIKAHIDVVIVAVTDDAIAKVASQIPEQENRLILHTSGSTNLEVLSSRFENVGVLYPLQTFSKNSDLDFSLIPLCLEANNDWAMQQLECLAKQLSNQVQRVNSDARAMLHVAAVFACNFTNFFYCIAQQLTDAVQLDFSLLHPLIQETTDKAMLNNPVDVQTGPARRDDKQTMQKHSDLLKNQLQLQALYQSISQYIVKMYHPNGLREINS